MAGSRNGPRADSGGRPSAAGRGGVQLLTASATDWLLSSRDQDGVAGGVAAIAQPDADDRMPSSREARTFMAVEAMDGRWR